LSSFNLSLSILVVVVAGHGESLAVWSPWAADVVLHG
jgi:hypothetical protein